MKPARFNAKKFVVPLAVLKVAKPRKKAATADVE